MEKRIFYERVLNNKTLNEVAKIFGLSIEKTRYIQDKAKKKLSNNKYVKSFNIK